MERSLDRSGEIGAARSYEGCLTASENTRIAAIIREGKAALGIELGSTRVKSVAVDADLNIIASGSAQWENSFTDGYWSYSEEEIFSALRASYAALKRDIEYRYGVTPRSFACMGISAMMHGYLAFDKNDKLLVPFRTWRNVTAARAAELLGQALGAHIPERWSIAHLYQAALDKESHVKEIASMNTLAGYVHYRLTGRKVLGVGDASGMFPTEGLAYDPEAAETVEAMLSAEGVNVKINEIFPEILTAGDIAGRLTEAGAALLDESGALEAGIPFCPPEGDAGTGMVATASLRPHTGNVSAGTSVFAMIVLDNKLRSFHKEIDAVATPSGDPVAMIHCNNCCGDIDDWFSVLSEAVTVCTGNVPDKDALYRALYGACNADEDADEDASDDVIAFNYLSGESITGITRGTPAVFRRGDRPFTLPKFVRSLLYSAVATLSIGMEILRSENVPVERIVAHGGFCKSAQGLRALSLALDAPVSAYATAGEGGAWGMAALAAYAASDKKLSLADYLDEKVFASAKSASTVADRAVRNDFRKYLATYKKLLTAEKEAEKIYE